MTIPDYQSLMLPVLRIAAQGETKVPDAAERIANELGLTGVEREELPPCSIIAVWMLGCSFVPFKLAI
jgi:restriction system protein